MVVVVVVGVSRDTVVAWICADVRIGVNGSKDIAVRPCVCGLER